MAIDPSGRFVYVANQGSENISAFSIDSMTGAFTAVAGSPFAATPLEMHLAAAIVVEPSGKFAYVANRFASAVSSRFPSMANGRLDSRSSPRLLTRDSPSAITFEPRSKYAYVVYSRHSGYITRLSIEPLLGSSLWEDMWPVSD